MSAARIIKRIRDAGGAISLAEDRLKISVPKSQSEQLMTDIRVSKDAIRRALKNEADQAWDGDDYRALFEERVAICIHDGGMENVLSQHVAYDDAQLHWLGLNAPRPTAPDKCAYCGGGTENVLLPVLPADDGHCWVH